MISVIVRVELLIEFVGVGFCVCGVVFMFSVWSKIPDT